MTAATSQEFAVTIARVPKGLLIASAYLHEPFRKYNRHAEDLLSIEAQAMGDHNGILIHRRRFP